MNDFLKLETPTRLPAIGLVTPDAIYPQTFSSAIADNEYLENPSARKLLEFFEAKGLQALKEEDQREAWYGDFIAYQAKHHLYASVLSPKAYSTLGFEFNLLKLTRFLEVFAYCSPAHGYSLQVSFLGLFSILMGSNDALKREAVASLEAGGLLAFGVSEKRHGSDLLVNQFTIRPTTEGHFVANGSKFYIGNANAASIISILARKHDPRANGRVRRLPFALFALRPATSKGYTNVQKIRTVGVRAGFVGGFDVVDHELPESDLIADGRNAWDAVFGTVTLGKFFLGFASIGICEHALSEAVDHLSHRILYDRPVLQMPHISAMVAQAYARLTAMKLYAYRALDYVHAASAADRRYVLFTAVQKAKISTEGVKVMALLSECVGAKGFEADTWFEMALRDIQLIPGLEGSTHINLDTTQQFIPRYFSNADSSLVRPRSLVAGECKSEENQYLMEARTGSLNSIAFPHFLDAYRPLCSVPNMCIFARQTKALNLLTRKIKLLNVPMEDTQVMLAVSQAFAITVFGQLVAENAAILRVPPHVVATVFHNLINDLSSAALAIAALAQLDDRIRARAVRIVAIPKTTTQDWPYLNSHIAAYAVQNDQATAAVGLPI